MKKQNKSFLFVLTFVLSAIISCFALNASAAEELQFSNASVEITFTENAGKHEVDDTFTVSGSFVSNAASDKKYYAVLTESGFDDTLRSVYVSDKYAISEGENTFTWDVGVVENANKLKIYVWTEDMVPICEPVEKLHSIRILAIGNSFSVDAEEYLYELLSTQNFNKVIVGNMYIGGCSLETHWNYAEANTAKYTYYRKDTHITGGAWKKWGSKTLGACIQDKYWDFFTLQQSSPLSGMPDTYEPYLTNLIDYVNENKTNENAKILWHMTWAYQSGSSHSGFANYNKDQLTMYQAIVDTMKSKVYPHSEIEFCIPAGTAIQNVRTSFIGDTLTRDGYHLSYTLGRYIAGLTWYNKITGFPIDDITYVPDDSVITKNHLKVIKECVKNAITSPEEITNSEYDDLEDFYDLANDYFELDWEPVGSAYWWSVKSINTYTTADNSKYFIASKKFTKEELPNGTLLVVDNGYQYRPEGWQTLDEVNTSDRPGNVTDNLVVVTDDWWSDYTIRAFNVAVEGGKTNISSEVDEVASHFRIYVPKSGLQISNGELAITFTENDESLDTDDSFTVSGSFDSNIAGAKYKVVLEAYDFDNTLEATFTSDVYSTTKGTNTFTYDAGVIEKAKKLKAFICTTTGTTPLFEPVWKIHSLKVFAIGNSFSVDAMQYLYQIAEDQGVNKIVLGNMYIGGCTLATHWASASDNRKAYTYYKNTTGEWVGEKYRMKAGITDEDWDLITLQQASGSSGMPDTYEPYLTNMINYINTNKTNPNAKIAWHMTWAYQGTSSHSAFANYNNDQMTMYQAIVDTMKSKVYPHSEIAFYIPSGTAIQNARTTFFGDYLTRDGYHLSYQTGRYIAGLTWYHKITGMPIDDIGYAPNYNTALNSYQAVIKESVKNAVLYPEQVTQSQYTDEKAFYDFENDYVEIDWEPQGSSYWNSTEYTTLNTTASNRIYYVSSKKFTKDELPTGTVIIVDKGYRYRPEGWQTLDAVNANTRPGNTTDNVAEVSDDWWGDYNYRAFNLSSTGSNVDISGKVEEAASHFRIYVPKSAISETTATEE